MTSPDLTEKSLKENHDLSSPLYDLILALCCIASIGLLLLSGLTSNNSELEIVVDWFDAGLCLFFFCDFIRNLKHAQNKLHYLYTWGWLDLLSCTPSIDLLRFGRFGRLFRLMRIFRVFRSLRVLFRMLLSRSVENSIPAMLALTFLLIGGAACGILIAEGDEPNALIKTAFDAVWWATTTVTTVGYGDVYPVSTAGRVVAMIVSVFGCGLFAMLTGIFAGAVIRSKQA